MATPTVILTPVQANSEQESLLQQKAFVDSLQASQKTNVQLADALYDLAIKYYNTNNYAESEKYFQQSLEVEQTLNRKDRIQKLWECCYRLGDTLLFQKRFSEAKAQYEKIVEMAKSKGDYTTLASVYANIAQLCRQINETKQAEEYILDGLKICDTQNNQHARALLLNAMGALCVGSNRLSQGIAAMEESARLMADDEDEEAYLALLQSLAKYQRYLGQLSSSNATYEELIKRVSEPPDPKLLMAAHLGIANNCVESGDMRGAREHFTKAIELSKGAEAADSEMMQTLIGLGNIESDLEHYKEAQQYHEQALQIATKTDDLTGQIYSINELATDCLLRGYPEQALEKIKEADRKTQNGADPILRGDVLTVMGRCYREIGQKDAAIGCYKEAIKLHAGGQRPDKQATALNSLATLYLDEHDIPKFEELYAQAKQLYSGMNNKHEEARLDYTLAQCKLMQNKIDEAIPLYKAATEKLSGCGDSGMQSSVLRGLGLAYYLKADYQNSLDCQLKALRESGDSGSIDTQWSNNLGVGKAYKAMGRHDLAEPYLRKALALAEQERSNLTRDSFKTYTLDLRRDCFYELVDLLCQTNRPYEAIEVAEKGKARSFLDMLANRRERRLDTALVASEIKAAATTQPGVPPVLIATADKGSRAINVQARPSKIIEETVLSPENAKAPTIDELKETVRKHGSTCVEYLTTNAKAYIWVVKPDGSISMAPPITLSKDFYQSLSDGFKVITKSAKSPEEMRACGLQRQHFLHYLYDLLIKPIEAELPNDKNAMVTIVPHGQLFCVPFAALMAKDGTYLVENHTLSYAPAIGVLRATQKLSDSLAASEHKLLAFGNPITKQNAFLGALPYAEKEVKNIASLFPAGSAMIEVGGEATKKKFTDLVSQASEIHLATHGLVDEEHPMNSAVILAPTASDEGVLSVSDIITLKNLKARLVVLSACQTGKGKITGDGVVGLSRAFVIAGTPSVIVSQWNVDDIMTEYQMSKFYNEYLTGTNKARALRNAQIATIAALENHHDGVSLNDPTFIRANPRLWAAFQLIGETK